MITFLDLAACEVLLMRETNRRLYISNTYFDDLWHKKNMLSSFDIKCDNVINTFTVHVVIH